MASERPDVGSSRISSSGSWRVARQALFLAPRKAENGRLLLLGQIDRLQDLRDAEGLWVEGAEQAERLADGESPMKCPGSGLSGDVCNAAGRAPVRILEPE